ncbi:similar to Saccharomyces cerevisiae YER151C UBP3 Ubiquitin-specific protease that interacts with Bre5p to co-regulate anterograde and retrograde transport between the ER and Golgi [Maudiozyma saulgeensis]|uniref:Ubiquitin carboxyl-terminal hydrolase n=1 Tax=Maudiozyma saulgeensis TaxID=1789683 RepID=A0A1X7R8B4_9SACH|nr:similar to Saccharomyces cerevisiae YER151C UBP3 Ubiquitin-specific protease that interacts with Bre5p to co-regulate anterograde and retrograde transport between the ER and Golgi [Kazachstania saulgeensis]
MNGSENQEESYSMYPKTSSPPPMPHVNMQFPIYQNPVPMYNYQTPYMYAQPNYNYKMMNPNQPHNQMGYQPNIPQGNMGSKKKWNNNNSSNSNNSNGASSTSTGITGTMNPAKSQPYYPNQSQSFYGQSASSSNNSNNSQTRNSRSSSVNHDPFKFDVSKLDVAKISETCKKFPLYINTTASEFNEARNKRLSVKSNDVNDDTEPQETTTNTKASEPSIPKETIEKTQTSQPELAKPIEAPTETKVEVVSTTTQENKKKSKDSEGKKKEKENRHKKEEETKKIASTTSTTSITSVASDDTTVTSSPISTTNSTATLTPAVETPAPKSWSAIASSAGAKVKSASSSKTASPHTHSRTTSIISASSTRPKKDKKYIPPTTKGAEPIGSIALRACFDPDYVGYVLKKHGPTGENDLPLKTIIPRGIINTANICFMSSVLQVLLYCRPFIDILNVLSTRNPNSRVSSCSTKLWDACINLFTSFDKESFDKGKESPVSGQSNSKKNSREGTPRSQQEKTDFASVADAIKPDEFYKSLSTIPKFKDLRWGHQEDAEEFLTQMLDQLHEELITAINNLTENEIQNILQSINDEELKIYIIRNLGRYKNAQFMKSATGQLPALIERYDEADDNDDENGWHEVSGTSKKGKKNKTAAKRTVEITPSPISNLFGGQFRSVLDIPNNKESQSITLDPFQTIQLDISDPEVNDLQSAFKKFSEYEMIPFRSSSGSDVEAKKQTFIDKLPEVLLIQLKRFSFINNTEKDNSMTNYNAYSGRIEKIRKKIAYQHELIIPADSVSSPTLKQHEENRQYGLSGVIYHHGMSSDGGHYTADVYHKTNNKWYRIDDVSITELKKEDVLTVGDSGSDPRTAYILMYQKL